MHDIVSKIEQLVLNGDRLIPEMIAKKKIKLGLRNADGTGVIAGITAKGSVLGQEKREQPDGTVEAHPIPGRLLYCGYDLVQMVTQLEKRSALDLRRRSTSCSRGVCPIEWSWIVSPALWQRWVRSIRKSVPY